MRVRVEKEIENVVALLAEGVDRNRKFKSCQPSHAGRPPRGGRG